MQIDKTKLKDTMGRPLTQSLFLEFGYETRFAVYTLKDEDFHYEKNGITYPSLKRLFIEMADPVEYDFANEYLLGWQHWKRLNDNKILSKHFSEWREELELSLRSEAIRSTIELVAEGKSFQASKWMAEGGWNKRGAGRPSKQEVLREKRIAEKLDDEYSAHVTRMNSFKGK